MTAKERDVRVAVVHRCFSEGGGSMGGFASEATKQLTSFSG